MAVVMERGCTCWEPVLDVDAVAPPETTAPFVVRPGGRCSGCAYRRDSPERTGNPHAAAEAELLEGLAAAGRPFWCHEGLPLAVAYTHPSGARIEGAGLDYQPVIVAGRPYRADGSPAVVCAGWAAAARRHGHDPLTAAGRSPT